jgi:hypothetical protein
MPLQLANPELTRIVMKLLQLRTLELTRKAMKPSDTENPELTRTALNAPNWKSFGMYIDTTRTGLTGLHCS